jgi:hypothetical protein
MHDDIPVDDVDDVLAFANRLATEYPNRLMKTEEAFISTTPIQVCVWGGDGDLMANIDILTGKVSIWIGEIIDIEHELDNALDQAEDGR